MVHHLLVTICVGRYHRYHLRHLRRRKNRLKWELKERELQEYEEKIRFLVNVSNELLPSFTEKGERELQIVELIRNRLRNGEKAKHLPK